MGKIKQWALTVCISCILVGAVELLLPKNQSEKSIKTVLALYILLAVLNTGQGWDWQAIQSPVSVPAADYSAYVGALAQEQYRTLLEQELWQAGVSGKVEMIGASEHVQVHCTTPTPWQAEEVLRPLLESGTELVIIKGEPEA